MNKYNPYVHLYIYIYISRHLLRRFPFYYEIKIILVLWLLSPATKGSSILYRRFVHPALIRREAEIDEALARATEQGYTAVLHLGTKGVNYATTVLMQTAIKVRPQYKPDIEASLLSLHKVSQSYIVVLHLKLKFSRSNLLKNKSLRMKNSAIIIGTLCT